MLSNLPYVCMVYLPRAFLTLLDCENCFLCIFLLHMNEAKYIENSYKHRQCPNYFIFNARQKDRKIFQNRSGKHSDIIGLKMDSARNRYIFVDNSESGVRSCISGYVYLIIL